MDEPQETFTAMSFVHLTDSCLLLLIKAFLLLRIAPLPIEKTSYSIGEETLMPIEGRFGGDFLCDSFDLVQRFWRHCPLISVCPPVVNDGLHHSIPNVGSLALRQGLDRI